MRPYGLGRLSGLTRVEGVNTPNIPVDIMHRETGAIVARLISGSDGSWSWNQANTNSTYDVIMRAPGKNAVISDTRKPVPITGPLEIDPYWNQVLVQATPFTGRPMVEKGPYIYNGNETRPTTRYTGMGPFPDTDAIAPSNFRSYTGTTARTINFLTEFIGTADFTAECMVKVKDGRTSDDTSGGAYPRIMQIGTSFTSARTTGFCLNYGPVGENSLYLTGFSNGVFTTMAGPIDARDILPPNEWRHVAVTRSGTMWRVFVNGKIIMSVNYSANQDFSTASSDGDVILNHRSVGWGCNALRPHLNTDGEALNGFFSCMRVTKGIARYVAEFIPPSAPFALPTEQPVPDMINGMRLTSAAWPDGYDVHSLNLGQYNYLFNEIPKKSGKSYVEIKIVLNNTNSSTTAIDIGVSVERFPFVWGNANGRFGTVVSSNGKTWTTLGLQRDNGKTWTTGDYIGVALDMDNRKVTFYKNGVFIDEVTGLPLEYFNFMIDAGGTPQSKVETNFGQKPFAYPPPAGFDVGWLCP
jgi:hypothetical protein